MNQEQAAAAFRAHHDAQPDVTVTLDLIPDHGDDGGSGAG
jgi:hypothetical protein